MEYAVGVAALWGLLVSFWVDAENRANDVDDSVNTVTVTVVGRDLIAVVEAS